MHTSTGAIMRTLTELTGHFDERYAISIDEAARRSGLSRSKVYEALKAGDLKSLKIGARRLIMIDELWAWLTGHQAT
jgi:excisionase family DNA binding protein